MGGLGGECRREKNEDQQNGQRDHRQASGQRQGDGAELDLHARETPEPDPMFQRFGGFAW
jgi:hypothetical protein